MSLEIKTALGALVNRLSAEHAQLSEVQTAAILALPGVVRTAVAGQVFVHEGDAPTHSCVIVAGLACRFKIVGDGTRQIHSFHLVGDMPDHQSLHLPKMDHSLSALRECRLAFIPHAPLRDLISHHPGLGAVFWRVSLIDASIFREWLSNVGRRPGLNRIAHLLCELLVRCRMLGATKDTTISVKITQAELADAQGEPPRICRRPQLLRGWGL
jgi:CRP-like cAMP-binding protein